MLRQRSFSSKINIFFLVILFSLIFRGKTALASGLNLKKNEDDLIRADKIYLDSLEDQEIISQEIKDLETELEGLKNDYIESSSGLRIYSGKNGLHHHILSTKLYNRKNKLANPRSSYDSRGHYLEDRAQVKEYNVDGYYSQADLDKMLKASLEVLDQLDLKLSFLKNTNFVISPYSIKSSNGYSVVRSNGKNTIVISHKSLDQPDYHEKIKATVLHEIGHIFYSENPYFQGPMPHLNWDSTNNPQDWKNSKLEAVAEEFRILTSTRLGAKSFQAYPSKTQDLLSQEEKNQLLDLLDL